ncbi:hypothetical protein ONS95_009603 [Cadophora gregata]|uniref:uncharacterized protein n=1 Tax=Cadophora gregata TaxID=51156 RepID=UPI0026DCAAE6|nr:uncharacterized protein ONS95_009603 [Cadophora gregata]KAK0124657.1 hypothetical protein ONS95_009603 [Cadophora gregata]KAK0129482.1 hypothetical protein ONS96_000052 [Cadophora gregata f. sp. sojae]
MAWMPPQRSSFIPQNHFVPPFLPAPHFGPAVLPPMAMSPMDMPYMVNPPPIPFRQSPVLPLPPFHPYSRFNTGFISPTQPSLPFGQNLYSWSQQRPVRSVNNATASASQSPFWRPIRVRIADNLFRNNTDSLTRAGLTALIEGYNSQVDPRDVVKIEHPTEADNNIEAAIMRIDVLQRALKDASKLEDDLDDALWDAEDSLLKEQCLSKIETATTLLIGAQKLSDMLQEWLMAELQGPQKVHDSTEVFGEIGQRAKEIEESWVGRSRKIFSQVSQMWGEDLSEEGAMAQLKHTDGDSRADQEQG